MKILNFLWKWPANLRFVNTDASDSAEFSHRNRKFMNICLYIHSRCGILALQWRSILVSFAGCEEGPKNPLFGIPVNPVVSASYAQSGVDAVGRRLRLRRTGYLQWHGEDDPVAVETGYCAAANSLRGIRPLYDTGYEPALRCYPALSRERCVQSSLPCVNRPGKGS